VAAGCERLADVYRGAHLIEDADGERGWKKQDEVPGEDVIG